ncbi:MAG: hypothetical protein JW394_0697 [Nitrospira sp.]|nr:hypothetical protein [Nitrospira sp.]
MQRLSDESARHPEIERGGDARRDREMGEFFVPHSQEVDEEEFVLGLDHALIIRYYGAIDCDGTDAARQRDD